MGAGASEVSRQQEAAATTLRYYCHGCSHASQNPIVTDGEMNCPHCYSPFLEEMHVRNSASVQTQYASQLSEHQSRRLASASIMLRLLEYQLREEMMNLRRLGLPLDGLLQDNDDDIGGSTSSSSGPLTPVMKSKMRRRVVDIDLLCAQPSCPICSNEFALDASETQLPCSHLFHESCLLPWLEMKRTCPICRFEINNELPSLAELEALSVDELNEKIGTLKAAPEREGESVDKVDGGGKVGAQVGVMQPMSLEDKAEAEEKSVENVIDTGTISSDSSGQNIKQALAKELLQLFKKNIQEAKDAVTRRHEELFLGPSSSRNASSRQLFLPSSSSNTNITSLSALLTNTAPGALLSDGGMGMDASDELDASSGPDIRQDGNGNYWIAAPPIGGGGVSNENDRMRATDPFRSSLGTIGPLVAAQERTAPSPRITLAPTMYTLRPNDSGVGFTPVRVNMSNSLGHAAAHSSPSSSSSLAARINSTQTSRAYTTPQSEA